MKGVIKKVDINKEKPLTVLWESCDEHPKEEILTHTGEHLYLLPTGIFGRKKISSRIEILAEATPGRMVEPMGVIANYSFYISAGTKGIVSKIDNSKETPIYVLFGNAEEYIPPKTGILCNSPSFLKIIRENPFDIWDLIDRYSPEDKKRL